MLSAFESHEDLLKGEFSNADRRNLMDALGESASKYRLNIYKNGFSCKQESLGLDKVITLVKVALKYLDHSIDLNKRTDNMFHAYNLMTVENDGGVSISYLEEMLEGQVAALSSGYLDSKTCLEILDGMKGSKLFREDQYSYLLYPNKELKGFMERNRIPKQSIEKSSLAMKLVEQSNSKIVDKDINL